MDKNIIDKLVSIQNKLNAPKSQYNSFGKYKYRSCEDILEALKPLLKEHGLVVTLNDEIQVFGNRIYVKATATLSDGVKEISVSAYAREDEQKKGMDGSQVTGAASSYARKYALNGLFAIDDAKDADSTNTHGQQTQQHIATSAPASMLTTAIDRVNACNDLNQIVAVWNEFSALAGNSEFKKACSERKKLLTA